MIKQELNTYGIEKACTEYNFPVPYTPHKIASYRRNAKKAKNEFKLEIDKNWFKVEFPTALTICKAWDFGISAIESYIHSLQQVQYFEMNNIDYHLKLKKGETHIDKTTIQIHTGEMLNCSDFA